MWWRVKVSLKATRWDQARCSTWWGGKLSVWTQGWAVTVLPGHTCLWTHVAVDTCAYGHTWLRRHMAEETRGCGQMCLWTHVAEETRAWLGWKLAAWTQWLYARRHVARCCREIWMYRRHSEIEKKTCAWWLDSGKSCSLCCHGEVSEVAPCCRCGETWAWRVWWPGHDALLTCGR